ncbi:hypothetical protein D9758_011188 [Tetrapyrgos nigripes]|uniref:F-box domain-containing protein n=1 Tax=Tetrapyrgos nigripes TaxID=182062 RepID=A0A8H5D6S4_9AGAR|nr:hypothetical protein D9758_011188 [Tetrapyrgos nigripes]
MANPVLLSEFPEPLYPELLECNDAPTLDQIFGLRMMINVAEECLSRLSSATFSLEVSRRAIRKEILRREEFLEKYRNLMHSIPMRRIPDKIWCMIFMKYVEMGYDTEVKRSEKKIPLPLQPHVVFTHICSRWKTIALSSPKLWSYIRFRLPTNPQMIQSWLTRSGSAPLSIKIDRFYTRSSGYELYSSDSGLRAVFLQSDRWVEFDIDVAGEMVFRDLFQEIDAPSLRRLNTRNSIATVRGQNISLPSFTANNLPNLRELIWTSHLLADLSSIPSYRNITVFSCTFECAQSISEIFDRIFHSMANLTALDLTIRRHFDASPQTQDLQPIVHSRLQSLRLYWTARNKQYFGGELTQSWSRRYIDCFLDNITFPSLVHFSIGGGDGIGRAEALSSFFSRHPTLVSLHFSLPFCKNLELQRSTHSFREQTKELLDSIQILHAVETHFYAPQMVSLPSGGDWAVIKEAEKEEEEKEEEKEGEKDEKEEKEEEEDEKDEKEEEEDCQHNTSERIPDYIV